MFEIETFQDLYSFGLEAKLDQICYKLIKFLLIQQIAFDSWDLSSMLLDLFLPWKLFLTHLI